MPPSKITSIESEGEHFQKLIFALRKAREAAERREWDQGFFRDAAKNAVALAFYRDDQRWMKVGAMLDEIAKHPPSRLEDKKKIVEHLDGIISAATRLMLRRLN